MDLKMENNIGIIIVIITSEKCGACVAVRGNNDGRPFKVAPREKRNIPGGHGWDTAFFKKLLIGGYEYNNKNPQEQIARIYEINFPMVSARSISDSKSFSSFDLKNNLLVRNTYFNNPEITKRLEEEGTPAYTEEPVNGLGYEELINSHIPSELSECLHHFPAYMYIDAGIWRNALKRHEKLYLYQIGMVGLGRKKNGEYEFARDQPPELMDPVVVVSKIIKGEILLRPNRDDLVPVKTTSNPSLGFKILARSV